MAYQSMLPTEEVAFLTKRLNELFGQVLAENADLKEKNEKLYTLGLNENTARFEDMKKIERLEDALKDEIKRNAKLIQDIMQDVQSLRQEKNELQTLIRESRHSQATAKEILQDMFYFLDGNSFWLEETGREVEYVKLDDALEFMREKAKEYGVEVEE